MSTDLFPEVTEDELVKFFAEVLAEVPLRSMKEIAADKIMGTQTDTIEIPATPRGPRHLAPYRGPKLWRNPLRWAEWHFGYWMYWGLNEQNRHRSHRVV